MPQTFGVMPACLSECQVPDRRSGTWRTHWIVLRRAFMVVGAAFAGCILGLVLVITAPGTARAATTEWVGDAHARARLVTAVEATGSGRQLDAGLEIDMAPGWHAYWRTPGVAGVPPVIDWKGSKNLAMATIAWPAPTRLVTYGLETFVYPDHVLLPISVALSGPGEPLTLKASVDYAACAKVCVPYHADLSLALPAGLAAAGPEAPLIAAAWQNVPQPLDAAGLSLISVSATPDGDKRAMLSIRLRSHGAAFDHPDLFVEGPPEGEAGKPDVALADSGRAVTLSTPVSGVTAATLAATPVTFTLTDGPRHVAEFVATPILRAGSVPSLLPIIGIALLGGLILNLMPCVLPVLSLKLLALAGLGGAERRDVRLSLLATASGVLVSFLLLAAALIGLRWAGAAIGWGIQFQQPWFLAAMATVTTLFAAGLWDWLPIGLPGAAQTMSGWHVRRKLADAFLTGAFATLLAASCSAPFVGTAIGFALARGTREILTIFVALGVGFAAPYLMVAALPVLVRWLPRPGRWMVWLRRALGFALAGTAAWLLYVLADVAGVAPAIAIVAALAGLLAVLAWRSRAAGPGKPARSALGACAATLVAVAVLSPPLAARLTPLTAIEAPSPRVPALWQPFDRAAIPRLVAGGKLVFVDVSAAWCLTCKLNELAVLDRAPVADRLRAPDVVAMRADWTRPDPVVTAYLQSFGRYGVPLDVVYGPATPQGEALPELLSASAVLGAFGRAADGKPVATGTDLLRSSAPRRQQ